jgi:hypothetical protein
MTKTNDLKKKLRYGDYSTIASVTGFSSDYVRKVINGVRNNEEVINVTKKLIEQRESLKENLNN